ncbi:MAG: hypothetical protein ACI91Z_001539 [Yoonia sp.]|jgi:hypothetical protein
MCEIDHTVWMDEDKCNSASRWIKSSCARLFDFMEDIEEIDRKDEAFSGFHNDRIQTDVKASPMKSESQEHGLGRGPSDLSSHSPAID